MRCEGEVQGLGAMVRCEGESEVRGWGVRVRCEGEFDDHDEDEGEGEVSEQ